MTGNNPGQCQAYEVVGGSTGSRAWYEALVTPIVQKVNGPEFEVEIVQWRWNQAVNLAGENVWFVWELDTDALSIQPIDLFADTEFYRGLWWAFGAVDGTNNPNLTNGYGMFAPLDEGRMQSTNGTIGNNREGKNACFFEGGAVSADAYEHIGLAGPPDDDLDNDEDGLVDEFVTTNGPMRNLDITAVNGLAKNLQLGVVAEGVEEIDQLELLAAQNCDIAQGYYFSRPVPCAEFESWVRQYISPTNVISRTA